MPRRVGPQTVDHVLLDDAIVVSTVRGQWSLTDARATAREIDGGLAATTSHLVLDLTCAESGPDVAMLIVLVTTRATMRRRRGRLTVVARGTRFKRLTRMSALDDLLEIVASLDEVPGVLRSGVAGRALGRAAGG